MNFTTLSLRQVLGIATASLLTVAIVASLAAVHLVAGKALEEAHAREILRIAYEARDRLDQELFERFRDMIAVARSLDGIEDLSTGRARATVDLVSRAYPDYSWIAVVAPDGTVAAATKGLIEGRSVASQPWFAEGLARPFVGDVHDAILLNRLLGDRPGGLPWRFVDFAVPLAGPQGKTVGVFAAHLNWDWASQLLAPFEARAEAGQRREVLILDKEGKVLHGPQALRGQVLPLPQPAQQSGEAIAADDGSWLTAAARSRGHQWFAGLGWTVVAREPLDEVYAPVRRMHQALALVFVPVGLLAMAAALTLARRVAAPLEALTRAAESAGEGRMPGTVDGYREIGALSRVLNDVLGRLVDSRAAAQAEALHRAVEARHLLAALDAHAIVSMADAAGNITYVNDKFCEISGYDRDDLLGRNHRLVRSERHPPEFYQSMWHTIAAGRTWQGHICNRAKDGSLYWVASTIVPAPRSADSTHRYVSIRTDITGVVWDREQMEMIGADLRRKTAKADFMHKIATTANAGASLEEVLAACLESIGAFTGWPVGHVFVVGPEDPDLLVPSGPWRIPDDTGRFDAFRKASMDIQFRKGIGLPGQVLASRRSQWVSDVTIYPHFARAEVALSVGLRAAFALPVMADDTVVAVIEFFSTDAMVPDNDLLQALDHIGIQLGHVFGRQRIARSLIDAKEQADRANRAKSEFLSSMSHELRTPLNAILGFAQILEMTQKNPLTEKQLDHVAQIIKGGYHLLELINEVLDLARIEAGKLSLSIETVELDPLLRECLTVVGGHADRRGIAIDTPGGPAGIEVHADRLRLKQVLLNLLSNAIKYNRPQGTVTVTTERRGGGSIRIAVRDTGAGIPPEKQSGLFQPFNRLGAESSDIEGTGIGLTICLRLMEAMGGDIGFTSVPGQGSTFWVEVPATSMARRDGGMGGAHLAVTARPGLPGAAAPRCRLLYVEDNPSNVRLLRTVVEEVPGIVLEVVPDAELGLDVVERERPDVVLLDINLPGMNGIEAVRRLKDNPATRDIPVIALSADAMPSTIEKALAAGFRDYLTKPVDVPRLLDAITSAIEENADA